jgi:hypothetical protein
VFNRISDARPLPDAHSRKTTRSGAILPAFAVSTTSPPARLGIWERLSVVVYVIKKKLHAHVIVLHLPNPTMHEVPVNIICPTNPMPDDS